VSGKKVKAERASKRTSFVFIREFLLEIYSCAYIDETVRPSVIRPKLFKVVSPRGDLHSRISAPER
jgi:hypothetical protein